MQIILTGKPILNHLKPHLELGRRQNSSFCVFVGRLLLLKNVCTHERAYLCMFALLYLDLYDKNFICSPIEFSIENKMYLGRDIYTHAYACMYDVLTRPSVDFRFIHT